MLLRDLLETPELHLRLLHGDTETLERPVRWTYSSDLLDPSRYLVGGELVISGLVWRRSAEDSETFVSNIAGAGAMALAAGEANFGCVPEDVIEACRRHDLVLIAVPEEVSFTGVTEQIIGSAALERGTRLEATLGRHRQLLASLAEGQALGQLVARVSAETGIDCRVMTATGRHVVPGPRPLRSEEQARVSRTFLTAHQFPAVARQRGGPTYSVFPVGPALGSRLTMWSVVADGDVTGWPASVVDAVAELAAITQLERSRIEEGRRILRPIADDAMRLVSTGATSQPETSVRLRQAGLEPTAEIAVVVSALGSAESAEEERAVVHEATAGLESVMVAQSPDGLTIALVPCLRDDWAQLLRTAFGRLAPGLGRRRLCVGISDPASLSGLAGMVEEARHARDLASLSDDPVSVVAGKEITSHVLLLATIPDDIRRLFATRVLGPVMDYDTAHDSGLLATVECFLKCSGSWNRAAQELHLHVNSVRYRIARVEELTGRDLSRLEDRVDVFLALRSL